MLDLRIGRVVIRHFVVRAVVLVALCCSAIIWWKYFHRYNVPTQAFLIHIPPVPITPTKEQMMHLPYNDEYLHVKLLHDGSLDLHSKKFEGPDANAALRTNLGEFFDQRVAGRVIDEEFSQREDLPIEQRIVRKIVVAAPPDKKYGDVVKLIDAIKDSGMDDIWIQIDGDNYWWEFNEYLS